MFFHFKGYNLEFICYFIVCNVILTECHSHTHQLIIPLKCPNLLLDIFTEWCHLHHFFLQNTENSYLFIWRPQNISTPILCLQSVS
jgi:hypothetical protein